jgi:hypothetical protein
MTKTYRFSKRAKQIAHLISVAGSVADSGTPKERFRGARMVAYLAGGLEDILAEDSPNFDRFAFRKLCGF